MDKTTKQERIVINVNHNAIRKVTTEATDYLILLERAKNGLKNLTEGNVKELKVEAIDNYLNNKTGFLNGLMSATAYNLQDEYNALKTLINDVDNGVNNLKFITKGKVDDAKINEAHTNYLKDSYVEEYLRLLEAVKMLNQSDTFVLNNAIMLDRQNGFRVNPSAFSNVKAMSSRQ